MTTYGIERNISIPSSFENKMSHVIEVPIGVFSCVFRDTREFNKAFKRTIPIITLGKETAKAYDRPYIKAREKYLNIHNTLTSLGINCDLNVRYKHDIWLDPSMVAGTYGHTKGDLMCRISFKSPKDLMVFKLAYWDDK